jgi:NADH:ubiquinone oxidoreductase subunit 2 (subunit N)
MIKDYFHSIPIPVRAKLFWIIIRDDFNLLKKDVSYGVFLIFVFFPFLVFLFYVKGEPEVYFILEVLFFLFVSGVRNSFFFPSRWKLESVLNQLQNVCGFTAILYLLILDGSRPDPFFWCYYFGMKYTRLFEDNIYLVYDKYTETAKFILLFCTFFFLFISMEFLITQAESQGINLVEFPVIVCFSVFFMLVLVSSFNFFGAYVSLEGITFSLYILAGMNYNSQNALESGVKYFCLGAISSGFLLFGVALIFIMTKTLDFRELRFLFESLKELPLLLSFALIFVFFGF